MKTTVTTILPDAIYAAVRTHTLISCCVQSVIEHTSFNRSFHMLGQYESVPPKDLSKHQSAAYLLLYQCILRDNTTTAGLYYLQRNSLWKKKY